MQIEGKRVIDFDQGLSKLRTIALFAQIAAMIVAATSAASAISVALFINNRWPEALIGTPDVHGVDMVFTIDAIGLIISWFVVGAWIYRAHANLQLTDTPGTEFTPEWAVGWFAIPIANLFKPFQAMKALWRVSHSQNPDTMESAPGILWAWWMTWILSSLGSFDGGVSGIHIVSYCATSVSALLIAFIIQQITEVQPSMSVARTFE